ncbi:ABC transporter permease [Baia soyae]|uniref:ABC-2 type transport system permease protein n=1 Tax=Baia soyae TaxID=1544746 RepID=A0A4R2RZ74_9BACL|nr:ABC transporter permease [Baia soyae]TCP70217.1 ABC-2 type transport system permease protein [Baia soyae]
MIFKLIQNEWMKIFNRASTYVMLALMVVFIAGTATFTYYTQPEHGVVPSKEKWTSELNKKNEQYDKEKTHANYYVRKNAVNQQAINNYRLQHDVSPYELTNVWKYMETNKNLIEVLAIFSIFMGASIVAHEFNQGTMKLLLIRSASRTQILLAKYLSTLIFVTGFLIVLFGLSYLIGSILFGFEGQSVYLTSVNGEVIERSRMLFIGASYLNSSIELLMLTSFAFMISTLFRSETASIVISILFLFMGERITDILALFTDWAKYLLFANTDLNAYFEGGPPVAGMTLTFSLIVLAVYLFIFMSLSFYFFKKRDVSI